MATNVATALATTYLHHNLQVPHLPPFRSVNQIATQHDSPQAPWSCGTIAILTTLHLTLGQVRPDRINPASITRRQYLTFHHALLAWLLFVTPPNLWELNCINTDIIRIAPIRIPERYHLCGFMQAAFLPRGTMAVPHDTNMRRSLHIAPASHPNPPPEVNSTNPTSPAPLLHNARTARPNNSTAPIRARTHT